MSTFIMSDKYQCFTDELVKRGHKIIAADTVKAFLLPEQKHADMQILPINDIIFLLNECAGLKDRLSDRNIVFCSKAAGKSYPENVLLNFLYLNNILYGKLSALDPTVKSYCIQNGIKTVNVNQGYCRCSTLVISERAVITSDSAVKKALERDGAEVLKISPGSIVLEGFDYGFIGGVGGKIDNNTVAFFGDITKHPDYEMIRNFCSAHNSNIEILCKNQPLTDIGGIVIIDN